MTEHTPGPWVRSPKDCDSDDWFPTCADAEWIVLGREGEGLPVAIVCGEYLGGDAGRLEANAKLIAAAPALLEAAKLQEAAEAAQADCDECEPGDSAELCPKCFPAFDDARIKRRLAIASA